MKITVLNGSPRKTNTTAMVDAFAEGAKEAGHEVEVLQVGRMKIAGCMACEYCHTTGEGQCVQKDDWQKVQPAFEDCDMIVFAWSEVAIDERIGIPPQTDASNAIVRPSLRASSKSSGP